MISALLVGLIAGFAGGYFVAQRTDAIPAPRSAAEAMAPVPTTAVQPQTYTDAPVSEETREPAQPEIPESPETSESTVARASSGPRGEPDNARPTGVSAPHPPGSLQVTSRPAGAQVFVDDLRVGVTPMSLADVSAGAHRVRIELPGFRRWATTVNVESGARARIGASLER